MKAAEKLTRMRFKKAERDLLASARRGEITQAVAQLLINEARRAHRLNKPCEEEAQAEIRRELNPRLRRADFSRAAREDLKTRQL